MKTRRVVGLLFVLFVGLAIAGLIIHVRSVAVRGEQAQSTAVDYFTPTKQSSAPSVEWIRSLDPGVGGSLIADSAGSVYLWYDTDSHVLKYDRRGKLLWNKRFVPRNQNGWCSIVSNLKGDLFMARLLGEQRVFSRLLPNGTLAGAIYLPRSTVMVEGSYAVDENGGWVLIEFIQSNTDERDGQEYLSRYTPTAMRKWSTYLQDVHTEMNLLKIGTSCNSGPQNLAFDAHGNTYLLTGYLKQLPWQTNRGVVDAKLMKFNSNGEVAWTKSVSSNSDTVITTQVDSAGNIFLTGQDDGRGYYVGKYNPNGKQVWVRQPKSDTCDVAEKLSVDKAGNIYVAGTVPESSQEQKAVVFIAKHDKTGRLLWRKEVPKITMLTGLAIADDEVYVSGAVVGTSEMYLIKLGQK